MSKEENTPYSFKGDNAKLVSSIKSLLALDSKGALVPNGIGGLARQLLESVVERLVVDAQAVEAIPLSDCVPGWHSDYNDGLFATEDAVVKLYRHPPAANVEGAAKKLAACMDYPWEHMPEQGRASMRENAKAVIDAALSVSAEPANKECGA